MLVATVRRCAVLWRSKAVLRTCVRSAPLRDRFMTHRSKSLARDPLSEQVRKLFIDCDAGVDDAQGLVLALGTPRVEVIGVSAICGNVGCRQVATNAARVLGLFTAPPPIYEGRSEPLSGKPLSPVTWYGADGLGDAPDASLAAQLPRPASGQASDRIVEAARDAPGELHLVALGPLTNLAVALQSEPRLPELVASLTVMGGAEDGGNVTPHAEFNFYCDPEAASLVLSKFPKTILVTYNAAVKHSMSWDAYDAWLSKETALATFLARIGASSVAHDRADSSGQGWLVYDPLAVAIAIDDSLVLQAEEVYCTVELRNEATRGKLIVSRAQDSKHRPNVRLPTSIDMQRVMQMLHTSIVDRQ